ncbi:growth hormone secretagogue receptor type 1 [Amblyraja radiata]|uniref:growth hormone secretagogue receptor type 1 n=1 Tax=Amblyraja radiata TaxID=386614 RepID=UPI0014023198|nr:growth hormone secretagogue receptor type 1 [Amblyraja radiata]
MVKLGHAGLRDDKAGGCGEQAAGSDNITLSRAWAVVIFAFVLCWLPFHIGRYLFSKAFEEWTERLYLISQYCNLVSCVLFYLSAAINPILYNIMSKKYRVAAFKLLRINQDLRRTPSKVKEHSCTESSVST